MTMSRGSTKTRNKTRVCILPSQFTKKCPKYNVKNVSAATEFFIPKYFLKFLYKCRKKEIFRRVRLTSTLLLLSFALKAMKNCQCRVPVFRYIWHIPAIMCIKKAVEFIFSLESNPSDGFNPHQLCC